MASLMAACIASSMPMPSAPNFSSISLRTAGCDASRNFASSEAGRAFTSIFFARCGSPLSEASMMREMPVRRQRSSTVR